MRRVFTCFLKSLFCCSFLLSLTQSNAQNNCVPIVPGSSQQNIALGCGANCTTLSLSVPHLKQTSDYAVQSIPFTPEPWTTATGTELTFLYADDKYSSLITLPFSFCFYDSSYNTCVAGSNGVLTFDPANQSFGSPGCNNAFKLNPGELIPQVQSVGTCGSIFTPYYPRASIMGVFQDIDPSVTAGHADRKIEYRVEGTAPCRKLILSYYNISMFSCNSDTSTSQIVIHEGTGIIEVFVKTKTICATWNAPGLGILGIQNWYGTKGVTPPGRNDAVWAATNEAYRFLPSGGTTRFVKSELLLNNIVVATGDTITVVPNELQINFPNVCPATVVSQYVIRTEFVNCTDPNNPLTRYDTINITKTAALTGTTTTTATTCGGNTGTVQVTATAGTGPWTFTLTGPGGPYAPQNSATNTVTFSNLPTGNYTIHIVDALGCNGDVTAFVDNLLDLSSTFTVTAASCPGINNGSITVTPDLGAAAGPYNYTLTGPGGPYTQNNVASAATFSNLAGGTYSVVFVNASGCQGTQTTMVVSPGTAPTASIAKTNTSCPGAIDGVVTVTLGAAAGTGPYTVTLNPGGIVQNNVPSPVIFNGLGPNTYTATFTNAAGCSGTTSSVTIFNGTAPTATITKTNTTCPGVNDGTVTVTPNGGAAQGPYTITLNPGGIVQSGVAASATFTGLAPNTYNATFTNAAGCNGSTLSVIVTAGAGVSGTATPTNTTCPSVNDGTITVNPGGVGPYVYTLNPGAVVQNNNPLFTGLAPGTYTITFTTGSGCSGTVSPNPVVAPGPALTSTFTQTNPPCANINDGTITILPGGFAPYSFTLTGPGGPYTQASPTFTNLAPGTYNYSFTDGNGCAGTGGPVTLTTNSPITTTVSMTMPLCNGNANGTITLTPSGGVPAYQYALSPFTTYQPGSTFSGLSAGIYTIRIKDNVGCTKDTTVTLNEPLLLTAFATNSSPASCFGNDGTITVTGNNGTPAYTYSIDGINYQAGNVFTAPAVGPYPNIKVKDANGCIANASTTVILVDGMFLFAGNDTTVCVESSVTLQPQTNAGTSIFNWRPLDPVVTLPNTIADPNIKNAVVTPTDTAIYILHATWGACQREDTITVNVLHKPVAHAGQDTAICNLTYAILRGSATNLSGTVNYAWSPATDITDPTLPVTTVYPPNSDTTYTYTLTVTDNYGCNFSVTDDVNVRVQPPVPAFAGNDTTAVLGVPHQLFGSGGVDYLWSPASPLNLATTQNPLATLSHDQLFILKVTDIAGCIGYDTVFIQVYEGPNYYVPNAFSPNGDGLNDIFRVIPVGIAKTDYLRIFNRYGELVFETNQWLKGWDGRYKGKLQPMGTYVWILKGVDKNGRVIEMKGTVLIVQ